MMGNKWFLCDPSCIVLQGYFGLVWRGLFIHWAGNCIAAGGGAGGGRPVSFVIRGPIGVQKPRGNGGLNGQSQITGPIHHLRKLAIGGNCGVIPASYELVIQGFRSTIQVRIIDGGCQTDVIVFDVVRIICMKHAEIDLVGVCHTGYFCLCIYYTCVFITHKIEIKRTL